MKHIVYILNIIIMTISIVAVILLFTCKTLAFDSKISLNVKKLSDFIPESEYTEDVKIEDMLGTDTVSVKIKFTLDSKDVNKVMNGDREKIDDLIISENVKGITSILHEPIDLITDFTVKAAMKNIVKKEITKQIRNAMNGNPAFSSPEEIMDEVGINDEYFESFADALYIEASRDGSNVGSMGVVLYDKVDEALAKAEETGAVDTSGFESKKASIKNTMADFLYGLDLVYDDDEYIDDEDQMKPLNKLSYIYVATYLEEELKGKVDESELVRKDSEDVVQYSDRLLDLYVKELMPDAFYRAVQYTALGLFIGLFVFSAIWLLLFIITLIKSFTKRPWTFFGPIFWIGGFLQLILGAGLIVLGKYVIPSISFSDTNIPLKEVIISPRTNIFYSSVCFIIIFILAFVYKYFKSGAKKELSEVKSDEAI